VNIPNFQSNLQAKATKHVRAVDPKQVLILVVTMFAIWQVGRSIQTSVHRQLFLQKQSQHLKTAQKQAEDVNKELRDGLANYRSSTGLERLARERLNLAGADEVIIRLSK